MTREWIKALGAVGIALQFINAGLPAITHVNPIIPLCIGGFLAGLQGYMHMEALNSTPGDIASMIEKAAKDLVARREADK